MKVASGVLFANFRKNGSFEGCSVSVADDWCVLFCFSNSVRENSSNIFNWFIRIEFGLQKCSYITEKRRKAVSHIQIFLHQSSEYLTCFTQVLQFIKCWSPVLSNISFINAERMKGSVSLGLILIQIWWNIWWQAYYPVVLQPSQLMTSENNMGDEEIIERTVVKSFK